MLLLTAVDMAGLAPKYVPKPLSKGMGFRNEWETEGPPSSVPYLAGVLGKFGLLPF